VGLMTEAGNPWTVSDALANTLVNQGRASPYNWPTAGVVSGAGIPRLGVVATRAGVNAFQTWGTAKQFMSRSSYVALDNITELKLLFSNWCAAADTETAGSLPATVYASIEYPIGTILATVTFGGSAAGTMPAGGDVMSDSVAVAMPMYARFAVRCFLDAPGGAPYSQQDGVNYLSSGIDACNFGTTATNVVNSMTAISNSNGGLHYKPTAVLGVTGQKCVALYGDSRVYGIQDYVDGMHGSIGELQRALVPAVATFQLSTPGATLQAAAASAAGHAKRRALIAAYCSHVASNLGINDQSTRSAAQMTADISTLALGLGKPYWHCTLPPGTVTSTDSFVTVANQTASGSNSTRVAFNGSIRAGGAQIAGYFEIADVVESARDSGKWKADGATANLYTSDGLHESQYANRQIAAAQVAAAFVARVRHIE